MGATRQAARAAHYPGSAGALPRRAGTALLWALAAATTACGGGAQVRPAAPATMAAGHGSAPVMPPTDPAAANAVLMRAISLVGTPYRYGGNSPDGGFDCSGLVNYVFRDMLDLRLPRTSRALADYQGPRVATASLAPADLVFFGHDGQVSHVGIYVGEGRFVHAPSTGGTVRLDHLDGPYWRTRYSGARRVLQ